MNRKTNSGGIDDKIERSSLGTAEARRLRAAVPATTAQMITSRAAAYPRRVSAKNPKELGG
jgi:hypothetical protein